MAHVHEERLLLDLLRRILRLFLPTSNSILERTDWQRGQIALRSSHCAMQAWWNRCPQLSFWMGHASPRMSKHTAHSS